VRVGGQEGGNRVAKDRQVAGMEKGRATMRPGPEEGSGEVSSNSPACCYLNPSRRRLEWIEVKDYSLPGISTHYF